MEKDSNSHKGQEAMQPLLCNLLKVFVCGTVLSQREAKYAFALLLVGKRKSVQLYMLHMLKAS